MPDVDCCIVGAGPAGVMLAYLLARKGVSVALLEAHKDFDREFRGDTLHPSALDILDSLGVADQVLSLPHTRVQRLSLETPDGIVSPINLEAIRAKYNYIAMMPQAAFLGCMTELAKKFPSFTLHMGARFDELLQPDGVVTGVRYQTDDGPREITAKLTVACDGRNSPVRHKAGLQESLRKASPPMDVVWFKLSRREADNVSFSGVIRNGHMLVTLPRTDHFQLGYVVLKGSFRELRERGIEQFRKGVGELRPELADRLDELKSFHELSLLSVESSCLTTWHRPGLLLIGDAAHVMSPVGGVGINFAIQDAVVAANRLHKPLREGTVSIANLAAVQRSREWPTRIVQWLQGQVQNLVIRQALDPRVKFRVPWFLRLPWLRDLPARIMAYGIWPVRVEE